MNEPWVTGLFTLLAALGAVALTQWFNGRRERSQREEREKQRREDYVESYRRTLFEKRLAAVQGANAWVAQLYLALADADPNNTVKANRDLEQKWTQALEWYFDNSIYLNDGFPERSPFMDFANRVMAYAVGGATEADIQNAYSGAKTMVRERLEELLRFETEYAQRNEH